MDQYKSLQLVLFSGKGGVGKTTLSCGFARHWAKQFSQEQILLISTDPAHSLGDVLQTPVEDIPHPLSDLANLQVRALDAHRLLDAFKRRYGEVLQLLVERGSFAEAEDLTPVWDLDWPGLDELMGLLEIQRILREKDVDRVVVDMAPSGHALNLLGLMDFLDTFLGTLDLFQQKHRAISQAFTGRHTTDNADVFLQEMQENLTQGRQLLQEQQKTNCLIVGIPEPMSLLETERFLTSLKALNIQAGGLLVNHVVKEENLDRYYEQQQVVRQFQEVAGDRPVFLIPQQGNEPVGNQALDDLFNQIETLSQPVISVPKPRLEIPEKILPSFSDFLTEKRRLIIVGGKGGVGKTTVAAAISWAIATRHAEQQIRVISIDPAHSLGDVFGQPLGHEALNLLPNLQGQEIDAEIMLSDFRQEYLWELADMMSGDAGKDENLQLLYLPEAWRKIMDQSLPGIDEILSLLAIMDLLETHNQDLIVLDTAPTGHLLKFLEMPTALTDWLTWIFKLWIKYQNVLGRTEFMGRLRTLRQRVVKAEKLLKNPEYTEFIGVIQQGTAIVSEQIRLTESLANLGIHQRYIVQNCFEADHEVVQEIFPEQTLIRLPRLPRSISPQERLEIAANLLF